jgi:cadmium resistance protein CadD (predicted permease)
MEASVPLIFAATVGFTHAFEIDHLLAVSSIVTRRKSIWKSVKDGIYWGLGHTSTILLIGMLMIVLRVAIAEQTFAYLEASVGLMLIVLGLQRLWKVWNQKNEPAHDHHNHDAQGHKLAYGVGLVHGLAGSGSLVLLVMSQLEGQFDGLLYLLIFGFGSIAGMLLASGVFSLPFSKKLHHMTWLKLGLTLVSSLFCIGLGLKVILENLQA